MRLLTLFLALGGLLPGPADKQLDEARERFQRALTTSQASERSAALEALVALRNVGAAPDLLGELARASRERADKRARLEHERFALERRQVVLEMLEARAERDADVADRLRAEREALKDLRRAVDSLERRLGDVEAWREELGGACAGLLEAVGASKRRKAEGELWKDLEQHPETDLRVAVAGVLADVGGTGTALRLARESVAAAEKLGKLRARLARELAEVRKEERRLQAESDQSGGRLSPASAAQYERVKAPALALQRQISASQQLGEELARAAGRALSREPPEELEPTLDALLRLAKKAEDLPRLNLLLVLASAEGDAARARLRALLGSEPDPVTRAELIDGLAALGDQEVVPWLLSEGLVDPSWRVASRAAAALARLRVRAAVPLLIERLDAVQGRLRSDCSRALVSLTGEDFHGNVELWRRWWEAEGETFEVPPQQPRPSAVEEARASAGLTFFGVQSESQSVLFVLDLSGSMSFSMSPGRNPDDRPDRPFDLPGPGEVSRLAAARAALVRALGGLRDGATFNLVTYASDVWSWSDEPVVMSPEARGALVAHVDSLEAEGGTNLYGALARAFDLAGAGGGGEWRPPLYDTIYLLTDGKASIGLTTDPDELLALVRDRNRAAGIVLHTIGLSAAHDAHLLRRLAEQNGGTYVAR